MIRYLYALAILALATCGTPALAQSLTLGNLKGPIAKASGKAEAKSIKDLWTQINGLPAPAQTVAPAPITAARAKLGVNVTQVNYWSNEPTFANQALGIGWLRGWQPIPAEQGGQDGLPLSVKGETLTGILIPPGTVYTGGDTTTVCTWKGTGDVYAGGEWSGPVARGPGTMTFRWSQGKPPRVWLELRASDAADPIRDLDCRLKSDTPDAVFASQLLDYLKPFGVLRFLDWSRANSSPAKVTWAARSKPAGISLFGDDGVALEYQIGLANAVGSSPWFTIPWNADADYHRQMAKMVHDAIPAGRPVYVELSNEVWNYTFYQTKQAELEGMAAKLSDNAFQAALYRYAQKTTEIMPIWAEAFKDRPNDLVRVVATQAANAWVGGQLFEWSNGAMTRHVDAIAIAPYFGTDLSLPGDAVERLSTEARSQMTKEVPAYTALAKQTGKRLIAYEGGQHLVDAGRLSAVQAANRDPRMADIYARYLADWKAATGGDLMTLYAATGPISQYGAWGLREYAGQPIAETPKLRGVIGR